MSWLPLLILPAAGLVVFLVISLARLDLDGKWHRRWGHHCGWHTRYESHTWDGFCPSCGEKAARSDFKTAIARAKWPLGWEYIERDDGWAK